MEASRSPPDFLRRLLSLRLPTRRRTRPPPPPPPPPPQPNSSCSSFMSSSFSLGPRRGRGRTKMKMKKKLRFHKKCRQRAKKADTKILENGKEKLSPGLTGPFHRVEGKKGNDKGGKYLRNPPISPISLDFPSLSLTSDLRARCRRRRRPPCLGIRPSVFRLRRVESSGWAEKLLELLGRRILLLLDVLLALDYDADRAPLLTLRSLRRIRMKGRDTCVRWNDA